MNNNLDFLQELYKEGVRFNVYEYAAQKVLKYEKLQKEKAKKIEELHLQWMIIYRSILPVYLTYSKIV